MRPVAWAENDGVAQGPFASKLCSYSVGVLLLAMWAEINAAAQGPFTRVAAELARDGASGLGNE